MKKIFVPLMIMLALMEIYSLKASEPMSYASSPFTEQVDLKLVKVVDDPTPTVGSMLTFTITVTNQSTEYSATNVEVKDLLINAFDYEDHDASHGSYNHVTGIWTLAEIAPQQSVTLEINARILELGSFCNLANITKRDQEETNIKNDGDIVCVDSEPSSGIDLGVTKDVYGAIGPEGHEAVFTITVTNLDQSISATNVELTDILDANLVYKSKSTSMGTYVPATGIWSIPVLPAGVTAILEITVTVNGSADNIAMLTDLDQEDTNPYNNEAMASVSVSGSSGGNDGGIESDGSLASKIAKRNFSRTKNSTHNLYNKPSQMIQFSENLVKSGIIESVSKLKGETDLVQMIPQNGPFGSEAHVSTPGDLLGISNAQEVFAVDYFDQTATRIGAILALTTDHGEVYNHTKMVCDRLVGASLELVKMVRIKEHNFIMAKLVQETGEVDYTISFISYQQGNQMVIDNKWEQKDYNPSFNATVFNFQVWSLTPQSTIEMVKELLTRMEEQYDLTIINENNQELPAVLVANGSYAHGVITLNIQNPSGITELHVTGTYSPTETSDREKIDLLMSIEPDAQQIEIPTGSIFDIDLRIAGLNAKSRDALYFADGTWREYFEEGEAIINEFEVYPSDSEAELDAFVLERNAHLSGEVKTYATLFRSLRAGNSSTDLSAYNTLEFEGMGSGLVEVILAKESINGWSDQYRTTVTLTPELEIYQIDLSKLSTKGSSTGMNPDDLMSVSFNVLGDGVNWSDFDINIKELKFKNLEINDGWANQKDITVNVYPNPVSNLANIEFNVPYEGNLNMLIMDITGKEVIRVGESYYTKGSHIVQMNTENLEDGIYFVTLYFDHQVESKRISVIR